MAAALGAARNRNRNSRRVGKDLAEKEIAERRQKLLRSSSSDIRLGSKSSLGHQSSTMDFSEQHSSAITLTDLFLSDFDKSDEQIDSGPCLIPLPPALFAIAQQVKEEADRQQAIKDQTGLGKIDELEQQKQKAAAALEVQLQQYWKTFASWPRTWPGPEKVRQRLQDFMTTFRDGEKGDGLVSHCGERLRVSAFVVICEENILLRSEPSTSNDHLTGDKIHAGELVVVDNILQYGKTKFLKLRRGGGWAFDRIDRVQNIARIVHTRCMAFVASIEIGLWWYRVVSQEYAEVRRAPGPGEKLRSGFVLCPGEVVVVALRCTVDEKSWLHLADGRGWIFERRPTRVEQMQKEDDSTGEVVMAECTEENGASMRVSEQDSALKANAVQIGMWEYETTRRVLAVGGSIAGCILEKGEKIKIDLRVPADGQKPEKTRMAQSRPPVAKRTWLRLNDGRGWVPKTDEDSRTLLRFLRIPGAPKPGVSSRRASSSESIMSMLPEGHEWMQGIA